MIVLFGVILVAIMIYSAVVYAGTWTVVVAGTIGLGAALAVGFAPKQASQEGLHSWAPIGDPGKSSPEAEAGGLMGAVAAGLVVGLVVLVLLGVLAFLFGGPSRSEMDCYDRTGSYDCLP